MSVERRRDERLLQDYLDGRLAPDDRTAFEARLGRESALRRQVQRAMAVREALRADDPQLSPEFYRRARARFEQSRADGEKRTFSLLSWETAGLAAAAALVFAVFLPRLIDQGVPSDLGAARVETRAPRETESAAPSDADAPIAPAASEKAPAPPGSLGERLEHAPAEQAAPPRRDEAEEERPWSPEPVVVAHGEREAGKDRGAGQGRAAEPLAGATAEAFSPKPKQKKESQRASQTRATDDALGLEPPQRQRIQKSARTARVGVELLTGLVGPGEIREVLDLAEWEALLRGPYGAALATLGAPSTDRRLVLIGPREQMVCDSLRVVSDSDSHRIGATRGAGTAAAGGGCALALARDGRSVVVE